MNWQAGQFAKAAHPPAAASPYRATAGPGQPGPTRPGRDPRIRRRPEGAPAWWRRSSSPAGCSPASTTGAQRAGHRRARLAPPRAGPRGGRLRRLADDNCSAPANSAIAIGFRLRRPADHDLSAAPRPPRSTRTSPRSTSTRRPRRACWRCELTHRGRFWLRTCIKPARALSPPPLTARLATMSDAAIKDHHGRCPRGQIGLPQRPWSASATTSASPPGCSSGS